MSLTRTTTRDGSVNSKVISLRRVTGLAVGLAMAVWIGSVISGAESPDTAGAVSSSSLTHEEFVRLNTTDLPALPVAAAAEPAAEGSVSPDIGATTVANANKDAYFIYINTGALEGTTVPSIEPHQRRSGPR